MLYQGCLSDYASQSTEPLYQDKKEEKEPRTIFYLFTMKPLFWHCLWQ